MDQLKLIHFQNVKLQRIKTLSLCVCVCVCAIFSYCFRSCAYPKLSVPCCIWCVSVIWLASMLSSYKHGFPFIALSSTGWVPFQLLTPFYASFPSREREQKGKANWISHRRELHSGLKLSTQLLWDVSQKLPCFLSSPIPSSPFFKKWGKKKERRRRSLWHWGEERWREETLTMRLVLQQIVGLSVKLWEGRG